MTDVAEDDSAAIVEEAIKETSEPIKEVEESSEPPAKRAKVDSIKLGPKSFESSEDLHLYFANILKKATLNQKFNEYEFRTTLELIKQGHHDPDSKIGAGVKHIKVQENPMFGNRSFYVVRNDGTSDDFSYRKCCLKLMPLSEKKLNAIGMKTHMNVSGNPKTGGGGGRG
eukprot:CAMPEP_0196580060 /NCGR_PEP_ID=MMETSP1081-20130531/26724_1 /TAXON_ID=36882 /ORGANISM="Pyramimonas amylifera, Strain CCMP720" /LENGTH=169 /DNA_ID=CAMNT_0041899829 /DNA_START=81 /DNA_END=586 /DNA_ORIENTATION=-